MEISEQYKRYIFVYGFLVMIVILIYLASTEKKFSCDDWANGFKQNFQCNIVLTDKDNGTAITTLTGIDLETKRIINCDDESKWLRDNFDSFKVGDTIIKNKGQYTILVKRKNLKIVIPFTCDNKVYKD